MAEVVYKFISLANFRRFAEILVYNKIYGASYRELNDPMECAFTNDTKWKDPETNLWKILKRTRICSFAVSKMEENGTFQEPYKDILMWSHYADGHKGACIKLEISSSYNKEWKRYSVNYSDELPRISNNVDQDFDEVVSTKKTIWKSENEVRYVRTYKDKHSFKENSPYIHIKIKAIYIGQKVKGPEASFLFRLIQSVNNDIDVLWMRSGTNDNVHYPELYPRNLKESPISV